ncbi:MAG: 50S ribosomal protein L4, partial [Clostridia bacterium]|nr:50S ribosomal protein L4 [Clostridia bacterium]
KLALREAKTKHVAKTVEALGVKGKVMFVLGEYDADVLLAARNIPTVSVSEARTLSVYDVVATKNLVLTVDAIKKIEEAVK